MKKVIFFCIIFLALINISYSQCVYTYTNQTSGVTSFLFTVKAVDANVGWAAGSPTSTGSTPIVRRTVNGGVTWTDGNPNPGVIVGAVYNIEAADSSNAWLTTSTSTTFIYKTTNGGANWSQVFSQAGGFIDVIKMQSLASGYAVGDPLTNGGAFVLLSTVNSGLTWTSVPTAPTSMSGEFGQNNSGQVMLPNIWFGSSLGNVYHSSNAGVTWTNSPSPLNTTGVFALRFNTTTTGLSVGAAAVNRSTNGGTSFATIPSLGTGAITGVSGNADSVYFYCRGTGLYLTSNNGNTFSSAFTGPGTYNALDLAVSNGCLVGWAVTGSGGITKITGTLSGIQPIGGEVPREYSLSQNYPNPFNPTTVFNFALPKASFVAIKIYDVIGREVAVLANENRPAGNYKVTFDASNYPSGVYFYSLQTSDFTNTKKMVLVK